MSNSNNSVNQSDRDIGLAEFRCLFGIPQGHDCLVSQVQNADQTRKLPIAQPTITVTATNRSRILVFLRVLSSPSFPPRPKPQQPRAPTPGQQQRQADEETALLSEYSAESEYATSVYMQLVQEESDQMRLYHVYNFITYFFLIAQVIIGALTALLSSLALLDPGSALSKRFTIVVASLGAVTAVLTGILSLLKGQGLPLRLQQFASRLRQIREKIEIKEKVLRMRGDAYQNGDGPTIKLSEALGMWEEYQNVIRERDINRPDAWATVDLSKRPGGDSSQDGNAAQRQEHADAHGAV